MNVKRRKFTAFEQSFIQQRANRCCEYCKFLLDYSHDAFHIEHIIPLILGGTYELFNLAFACDGCNLGWLMLGKHFERMVFIRLRNSNKSP